MPAKEGSKAPAFSIADQDGKRQATKDWNGKWVVLYFYPKDMTPGCTTEACDFRDSMAKLKRMGVVVKGVSKDSSERHQKFIDKYELNFDLLSDTEGKACEKFGVWREKNLYGKKSMGIVRSTFIIDDKGKVAKIYDKVRVKGHVDQVIEDLKDLQSS